MPKCQFFTLLKPHLNIWIKNDTFSKLSNKFLCLVQQHKINSSGWVGESLISAHKIWMVILCDEIETKCLTILRSSLRKLCKQIQHEKVIYKL